MKPYMAFRVLVTGLAILAGPASAHVVLAETEAVAGTYHAAFFRISHGCGDSATVRLRIGIPEGIGSVAPQPKPGWSLSVERTGGRVLAIVWEGRLEAAHFEQFGAMLRLPATPATLYFPTIQTCEEGENRWTQIPSAGAAWGSVPYPAPVLEIRPAGVAGHH